MNQGVWTVLYPVEDLQKAKSLFTKLLGVDPIADAPYYVGYRVADQDIGLVPDGGQQGMTGVTPYFSVPDIRQALQGLIDGGATLVQDVRDVGYGKLVASVKDADGNMIGITQLP